MGIFARLHLLGLPVCVFPCSCVCEYSVCLWVNAPLGVCVFPVCMRVFAGASGWAPLYCSSYAEGTILSVSLCRSASSDGPSILVSYLERHTVRCKRETGTFFSPFKPPSIPLSAPLFPPFLLPTVLSRCTLSFSQLSGAAHF